MKAAELLQGIRHNINAYTQIVYALNAMFNGWSSNTKFHSVQIRDIIKGLGVINTQAKKDAFMYLQTEMGYADREEHAALRIA